MGHDQGDAAEGEGDEPVAVQVAVVDPVERERLDQPDPSAQRGHWLVAARLARFVAEALPTARCETFADSAHVPQYEHPERTNALIRAFLAE